MDMFIMTNLEHTSVHRLTNRKNQRKHPAFKDKSGDIKKVVVVRRRLV